MNDPHIERPDHTPPNGIPGLTVASRTQAPVVFERKSKAPMIVLGIAIGLLGISSILSQIFSWDEVSALRFRINEVSVLRNIEQEQENCLELYTTDLYYAQALAQVASNNVLSSIGSRDPNLSLEEQVEDNRRLATELQIATQPVLDAAEALVRYQSTIPAPVDCPHPKSEVIEDWQNRLGKVEG